MDDVNLGDKVKDSISGFTGTVTGLATYLHTSAQAFVSSDKLAPNTGATVEEWFNVSRLTKI